jgi:penicillin amidase
MVTTPADNLTVAPPVRRPLWPRVLGGLVLAVLLILAGAGAYFYSVARSALPQLDGTISVSGLAAPVDVIRDPRGIPTIEAKSLEDLFFAQGYVTAQDRLWQMDVMRRFAAGDMAEVAGPALLRHDREQRILGLRAAAEKAVAALSWRDRSYFEAYTRGVNAFIDSHRDRLPIEFRLMGYKPRRWVAEDSMVIGGRLIQDLNHGTYVAALEREKVLAKLGPELAADMYVNTSWHDRPPSAKTHHIEELKPQNDDDEDDEMDSGSDSNIAERIAPPVFSTQLPARPTLIPGSNDWVISGAHTVTGKPMLSNDMHLNHQMPNLWYEAHLHCDNYDVIGVTLPGLPFVIVGHNQRIAWGFTNVGPTVEDLYIEQFNDKGQYEAPEGSAKKPTPEWRDAQHREEIIHVKGQPDVRLDVIVTRHGPIITDLIPGETRKIALKWTLYDSLHNPFFDVDSAQKWDDFLKALETWDSPAQNAVYADVDGHIGYHATAHVPIRKTGDG